MKYLVVLFSFLITTLFGNYSIVFVHIGDKIPAYTRDSIEQARLFNPNAQIILLGSSQGLLPFEELERNQHIQLFSYDNLKISKIHQEYQNRCRETSDFWRYTSERFLYLWDLIEEKQIENVFHLENDNMIYTNFETLLPIFRKQYPGIGATFDNDERCIPGIVWIANPSSMKALAEYFVLKAPEKPNDMQVIGEYRKVKGAKQIDSLPIVMPEYLQSKQLQSPHRHQTKNPRGYFQNSREFGGIFDAAAIGQYLGGNDPIHQNAEPAFVNESCLFNPSIFEYQWIEDEEGRLVPYAIFGGKKYIIFNLHVHCKRLYQFSS